MQAGQFETILRAGLGFPSADRPKQARVNPRPATVNSAMCPICWEASHDAMVAVPCGHVFHRACFSQYVHTVADLYFEEWKLVRVACPKCRAPCDGRMSRLGSARGLPFYFALGPSEDGLPSTFMRGMTVYL